MISTSTTNNCNYYSVKSIACIILLLSGFIQYCFYIPVSSFDNSAYGQKQIVEEERLGDSTNEDPETSALSVTTDEVISEDNPPPNEDNPPPNEDNPPPNE